MILDGLVAIVSFDGQEEAAQRQVVDAEPGQETQVDEHSNRGLKVLEILQLL